MDRSYQTSLLTLAQKGDYTGALTGVFQAVDYDPSQATQRTQLVSVFLQIISMIPQAQISQVAKDLAVNGDDENQVTAMKFLYKAMENPVDQGGNINNLVLLWHQQLVDIAGTSLIVKVMSDPRRL